MRLSAREQAVLQACTAAATTDRELAELARFFNQVHGAEPMPDHERITGRLVSVLALAWALFCAVGRLTWYIAEVSLQDSANYACPW